MGTEVLAQKSARHKYREGGKWPGGFLIDFKFQENI